jgi:tetratricopeptide (TPR) repeat protein
VVKKQQLLVVFIGLVVLVGLCFGRTIPDTVEKPGGNASAGNERLDFPAMLAIAKQKVTPAQLAYITQLEHAVVRGDVKAQQIEAYKHLAAFWGDSAKIFVPFVEYTSLAAKLENSEKSLTFAANLFFEDLQSVQEAPLRSWEADQAKDLYNRVLALDPGNDSVKVSLGSCYIFGSTSGSPQETMQGILKIREVAERDSTNMYAQYMLGLAGIVSGQTDKAIDRFQTVLRHDPDNLDVQMRLADLFEQKGNRAAAHKTYLDLRSTYNRLVGTGKLKNDTSFLREINKRIQLSPVVR